MAEESMIVSSDTYHFRYHTNTIEYNAHSMHTHNYYEILYFLAGDATHVIEDKKHKLKRGDLIVIRPRKYHFIQIDSTCVYKRCNILFDPKKLGIDMTPLSKNFDVVNIEEGSTVDGIFKRFTEYFSKFSEEKFISISKLLLQELIYNLSIIDVDSESDKFHPTSATLSRALNYIKENLFTLADVSEVAKSVFVTESYLFKLFRKELHKTPKKYITEKRLLYAQNQLRKGKRSTEVAASCGFEDYTTFYRNYLSFFSHSPSSEK